MPAPATIVMRYGDNGLLGQAAATAGYGTGLLDLQRRQDAARQQGYATDLSFINQDLQRRQQADEFAQQQQMQANQLQQAAAQQRQPDPGSGTVSYAGGADTIRGMKSLALSNVLGDTEIDPATRTQLEGLAAHDGVPLDQVTTLAKGAVAAAQQTANKKAKDDYVKTVLPTLPPDEQAGIASLAASDSVTPQQLRAAIDEVKTRTGVVSHQHQQAALTGIDAQARTLAAQARELERQLQQAGFDPSKGPAQFNPQVADPNASTYNTLGFKGSLGDAAFGNGKLVTGGDSATLGVYTQYARVQQQLQELLAQREQIIKGGGSQPAASPAAAGGSISITPSTGAQQQQAAANPAAALSDADLLKALGQ